MAKKIKSNTKKERGKNSECHYFDQVKKYSNKILPLMAAPKSSTPIFIIKKENEICGNSSK